MAPRQPPLSAYAAFERDGILPPDEPSRFSSNPTFDQGFIAAAYDGDLRLVKSTPPRTPPIISSIFLPRSISLLIIGADAFYVSGAARTLGRGAEGRRLADKLGAVRDGYGNGLLHAAVVGGSLPVCRYLVEDLRLDVDDVGLMGASPSNQALSFPFLSVISSSHSRTESS
jgi:hypothetical protein